MDANGAETILDGFVGAMEEHQKNSKCSKLDQELIGFDWVLRLLGSL
jgi:hypothetical protein